MPAIASVKGREIFNSAGYPALEVTVKLSSGVEATSSAPHSHSKGSFEARDISDKDISRYEGRGMLKAVTSLVGISEKLKGIEVFEQQKIDSILNSMDGTENKSVLGANVMLAVSQAAAKAAAMSSSIPLFLYLRQFTSIRETALKLPLPMFVLIEGGKWVKGGIDFQSILLLPASSQDVYTGIQMGIDLIHLLEKYLEERNNVTLNAPLGGFSVPSQSNTDAISFAKQFIESTSYKFSEDLFLGVNVNANTLLNGQAYRISDRANPVSSSELIDFYKNLAEEYSLIFLEDPLGDNDSAAWAQLAATLSDEIMISGNDLIGGNPLRLQTAIQGNLTNSVSINPGHIGTVSEALAFAEIARYKKFKMTIFDRGYTTNDDFIVDFAVAVGADYLKAGAPLRERVFKYNRLLEIENEIETLK